MSILQIINLKAGNNILTETITLDRLYFIIYRISNSSLVGNFGNDECGSV